MIKELDFITMKDEGDGENAKIMLTRAPWDGMIVRYGKVSMDDDTNTLHFHVHVLYPPEDKIKYDSGVNLPDDLREYLGDLVVFFLQESLNKDES